MKSAEKILKSFMYSWKNEDWEEMWKNTQITWHSKKMNNVKMLSDLFGVKKLQDYKIVETNAISNCCTDIEVLITYSTSEMPDKKVTIKPRLLKEIKEYRPSPDGRWGVNPISALREF